MRGLQLEQVLAQGRVQGLVRQRRAQVQELQQALALVQRPLGVVAERVLVQTPPQRVQVVERERPRPVLAQGLQAQLLGPSQGRVMPRC